MRSTLQCTTRMGRVVLGLLLALLIARLWGMAALPLMDTTEARYAEIGRKMAEWGDWVTPWHDTGIPFWGKPPLSFWLTALSFKLFGISEFTARLPHLLCSLAIAACVGHLARQRSPREGLLSVSLLAGSTVFFLCSAAVMTDAALVLGSTLSLSTFWGALHESTRARARLYGYLFFASLAWGMLAKGPIALVLTGVPLSLWVLWESRWQAVWERLPWLGGLALATALTAPWYVLAELRTPGFLQYFLIGEHWHRFVTPGWTGDKYGTAHRYPPGTIWLFAALAWLPWTLFLPIAALQWRRSPAPPASPPGTDRAWHRYLWLWALTPLLFFTVARNIIWPYVLPATPAMALLLGTWLARRPPSAEKWVATGLGLLLLALLALDNPWVLPHAALSRASAKNLVAAYEARHTPGQALIYVGRRPFSAAFYSRGQALVVTNPADVAAQVPAAGAWLAVQPAQSDTLGLLVTRTRVGALGEFDLIEVLPK